MFASLGTIDISSEVIMKNLYCTMFPFLLLPWLLGVLKPAIILVASTMHPKLVA